MSDSIGTGLGLASFHLGVAQLAAHVPWGHGVMGSSPITQTIPAEAGDIVPGLFDRGRRVVPV